MKKKKLYFEVFNRVVPDLSLPEIKENSQLLFGLKEIAHIVAVCVDAELEDADPQTEPELDKMVEMVKQTVHARIADQKPTR